MNPEPNPISDTVSAASPSRDFAPKAIQDRRRFLQIAGAPLLGALALPKSAEAGIDRVGADFTSYGIGIVANSDLPGEAGDLFLTVYVAVDADGAGFGTLGDPVHPAAGCHLAVMASSSHSNRWHFEGQVIRSTTPSRVGQLFDIAAILHNDFTELAVTLNGQTFSGKGVLVKGNSTAFGDGSVRF